MGRIGRMDRMDAIGRIELTALVTLGGDGLFDSDALYDADRD